MTFNFFPSKKAQGMSLKIVVIAVICIVILVVLIMIFTGKTKFFSKVTADCASKGGGAQCMPSPCGAGHITHLGATCEEGQSCCAPFDPMGSPPAATGKATN